MMTIPVGPQLVELLGLAYAAKQPVLLHGRHGAGKSEIFAHAAAQLDIDIIVRDLSLLEPPDLIGIPRVGEDGRTHYAAPAFLPQEGCGLLVFEELNRCPRYMQSPCLQLLTARTLNSYTLPEGWLPCAAVNDAADGYFTDELDPALLSRFLQVKVVPDVAAWLLWAKGNSIHPKVIDFIEQSPGVFDDPETNPRAWAYVSRLLTAWEHSAREQTLLPTALAGVLDERWALAFLKVYQSTRRPLRPEDIIDAYPSHQATVRQWITQGYLDVVAASVERLKRHMQPQRVYETIVHNTSQKASVEAFLADLPADLKRQMREWLVERGFTALSNTPQSKRTVRP